MGTALCINAAKHCGKSLGRRKVVCDRDKVRELSKHGLSVRKIAAELNLTKSTVQNLLKAV